MLRFGMAMLAMAAMAGCAQADGESADPAAPECDYDCTLDRHLTAIRGGDWDGFVATITAEPDIQLILPDGTLIEGREAYLETLEPWLTGGGFTFDTETVDQRVGSDLGYTLLNVTSRVEAEDRTSTFFLLLTFALEDGEWRLVHDQNTRIPPAAEAPAGG
ncbi:MAG: nuclear transport factor 2 family protein [Parasphingopyxis sp.]|uniref:YybH family protein n=1 Tax=Parasphingopyxis sp. TaxID=1920299 RepID=UPI002636A268|nr:nuclear transport factor 2 family protein [uncultured Parasphingopyxis sp.]